MRIAFILFLQLSLTSMFGQKAEYVKSYYEDNQIKSEGWIKGTEKSNYWKYYYDNGNIKKEGRYKNGKPTKYWYFYNEDKSKLEEGHFIKGFKFKWWILYEKNKIAHKIQYDFNKKNGYCLCYAKGKIFKVVRYKNDLKEGEWTDLKKFKKENKF
ncbi:toxin-antitoxin system YwqK family antitoxin [Lutibacter citreus]|uniref:toxin-antitoxin system YwqK family antitoxin n=1 Tax=Lutibacter citreus TaxID=2138210 RepID=UPI001300A1C8|nr:hypothetical protein [Lutibacter citreus]